MRCDECRFWDTASDKQRALNSPVRQCTRAMPFWDATKWNELGNGYGRVMLPEFADRKFFAQDGSDYVAVVLTMPDFFCAEFQQIEK